MARTQTAPPAGKPKTVAIGRVQTSALNPRKTFRDDSLVELAASISQFGILEPLIVRSLGHKKDWELIAGERRLRAARLAGLKEVPVVEWDVTESEALAIAVVENEQREDVPILERIEGYVRLISDHGLTLEEVAQRTGKSAATIRGLVSLRHLPDRSRAALAAGEISASIAQLIACRPTQFQRELVENRVINNPLGKTYSVRELKEWIEAKLSRELKGAPFKTADKKLYPEAGSCKDCPKRTGNIPGATGRADVCTDPGCYQEKVSRYVESLVTEYDRRGVVVLSHDQAWVMFDESNRLREGGYYVELDDSCPMPSGKSRQTWRDLVGGSVPDSELHVIVDGSYKIRELVKARWAEAFVAHTAPPPEAPKPKPAKPAPPLLAVPLPTISLEDRIDEVRRQCAEIFSRVADPDSPRTSAETLQELLRLVAWHFVDAGNSEDVLEADRLYGRVDLDSPFSLAPDGPEMATATAQELTEYVAALLIARVAWGEVHSVDSMRDWFSPAKAEQSA